MSYYPAYRRPDTGFSNSGSNYHLATGEAEDRYNPAQPYLPPHKPDEDKKPSMPPPPVPMPPPPPPPQPQPYMNAPSISYDSIPSYSPPDSSKPDTSGPPSDNSYSYPSPDDSGPPPSFDSSDDQHHHPHHDDFKFESPPDSHDSDNYPQLIYEDHHPHHDDHDHDHDHIVYHHHHHTTTTPPPPPPTTAAPEVEDTRVTNRFSYYYLGKKLWYLPLYFSVYFIIYVGALIIKSIARHKITYPQHFKTKRSLGFNISEDDLHNLTRLTCNALFNAAEKYLMKS